MARHEPFGPAGKLWLPPGGGMNYNESAHDTLIREFREETSLKVIPGKLLFVNEILHNPYHSIELFFEIDEFEGNVKKGIDPELSSDNQILSEIKFISEAEINKMPMEILHNIFKYLKNKEGLISFESLLRINGKYIS